jgi:hypothetical protein
MCMYGKISFGINILNICFKSCKCYQPRIFQSNQAASNSLQLPAAIVALGLTQPLTEMSTKSRKIMFLESKVRPVRRADNLAAICEPIVYIICDP